jgi:hypothetical protein
VKIIQAMEILQHQTNKKHEFQVSFLHGKNNAQPHRPTATGFDKEITAIM